MLAGRLRTEAGFAQKELTKWLIHILMPACLLITSGCCSSPHQRAVNNSNPSTEDATTRAAALRAEGFATELDFALTNQTGAILRAVYISPTDSQQWGTNLVKGDDIQDGDTINVRFNSAEKSNLWDLRVEAPNGYYTEWKNIDLRTVAKITLHARLDNEGVGVAEIE